MANKKKTTKQKLHDLQEWMKNYREWYEKNKEKFSTLDEGSNPPTPPPPPPGENDEDGE